MSGFTETGYSDFKGKGWMSGSAVIRTLFGFVNLYKILDNPLPIFPHLNWNRLVDRIGVEG